MATRNGSQEEVMRQTLRKLLADPQCNRLFGRGKQNGLFPSGSATNRRLAQELVSRGFLQANLNEEGNPACSLTTTGRQWLMEHEDPSLLLEDLLTATERQQELLAECLSQFEQQATHWRQQKESIESVLTRFRPPGNESTEPSLVEHHLERHANSGNPTACSIAVLYRQLQSASTGLTIGQFHDTLRQLHELGRIEFTPWTGPLYEIPEPSLALLIGHEVLYYVRLRRHHAA